MRRNDLQRVAIRGNEVVLFDPLSLAILTSLADDGQPYAAELAADRPERLAATEQVHRAAVVSSDRPRLRRLTINIANTCNLACRYCYAVGGNYALPEALMSGERAAELVGEALRLWDVETLMFFGGEPSLNPDAIAEVCLLVTELHRQRPDRHAAPLCRDQQPGWRRRDL